MNFRNFALLSTIVLLACRTPKETEEEGNNDTDSATESGDSAKANLQGALDIKISRIEIQQGVPIIVSDGSKKVDPTDDEISLLDHRRTLFRVHFDVSDNWEERKITARLILEQPATDEDDAKIHEIDQTKEIRWDSRPNYLSDTFHWLVAPQIVEPGLRYAIELYEAKEESNTDGDDDKDDQRKDDAPPRYPEEGTDKLDISDEKLKLEIKFVPIHYTGGEEEVTADLTDEVIKKITENVIAKNPIGEDELVYSVDDPLKFEEPIMGLDQLLPVLQRAKEDRGIPSHVYYHGIFYTNGSNSVKSVAGIAFIAQPFKNNSLLRVGASVLGNRLDITADTITHEIGHNQGLKHVECPQAESAGPDSSFPYENGHIGGPGYDIFEARLHDPGTTYDYMSYCNPIFAADWTWKKSQKRIREITQWSGARELEEENQDSRVVFGLLNAENLESWWTLSTSLPDGQQPTEQSGQCRTATGQSIVLPGVRGLLSDDRSQWVAFELPSGTHCSSVSLSIGAGFRTIPMEKLGPRPIHFAAKPLAN